MWLNVGLTLLGLLMSGFVVGYLMGGAAKLGGEEDSRRDAEPKR